MSCVDALGVLCALAVIAHLEMRLRIALLRVDKVGEEDGVADEEDGSVVADLRTVI